MTQGWPQVCHVGGGRRLNAGDHETRRRRSGLAGNALQSTGKGAARLIREPELGRIEWWWWPSLGWPETAPALRFAAAQSGERRKLG